MKTKKLSLIVFLVMISVFMSVVGVIAYDSNLVLEDKTPETWTIIQGGMQATLQYNSFGPTFTGELTTTGLNSGTSYALIYYPDKIDRFASDNWNGEGGIVITTFSGNVANLGINKDLETSLPAAGDWNIAPTPDYCNNHNDYDNYVHCSGAKIWIVKTSDLTDGNILPLINWNPTEWLFETDLIEYTQSESQDAEADLLDTVSISVSPSSLIFGATPRGTNIIKEATNNPINIDTTGSDTELDKVYVYLSIEDDTEDFYKNLLEIELLTDSWQNIYAWNGYLTLPENTATNHFNMRLHGNTTIYSSGPKTAKIIYTAFGEFLTP